MVVCCHPYSFGRPIYYLFLKLRGGWSLCTSGYADGHRVHIYFSNTNTGVMTIVMISSSRGGHVGFFVIEKGPGPPGTSVYADGHRVQIYVSITNTEGVIAILMLS